VRDRANNDQIVRALNDLWALVRGIGGTILFPDGTVAAPGGAFANNTGVGFYLFDDASNAGALASNNVAVLIWSSAGVNVDVPLTLTSGQALVLNNAGDTNSANLKHSGTNDVLKTDDGLQVAAALNVGASIVSSAAGYAYIAARLGVNVAPSYALHVAASFAGDRVAQIEQTSSAAGSAGLFVLNANTSASDAILHVESGGTLRFRVNGDGSIRGKGDEPIQKAPQSAAASVSPALTTSYASFSPACSVSLGIGNWIVEGTFWFSCGDAADVNQVAFGKLNVVSGSATIGLSTSEALATLEVNGNGYMATRSWPVTVTAAAVIELQVKKSGGAGSSTANATHTTILASYDGNPV
jgi:hypothetical protein